MRSPVHQVRKGQQWSAKLAIKPHTEVMESHLRRHTRLKPAEVMRSFAIEAEGMPELLIHGLYDLAYSSQPASEPLGPWHAAVALRWADDLSAIGPPPGLMVGVPLEALVDDVGPAGRGASGEHA